MVSGVQYPSLPLDGGVMPKCWPGGRAGSAATAQNDNISSPLHWEDLGMAPFRLSDRVINDISSKDVGRFFIVHLQHQLSCNYSNFDCFVINLLCSSCSRNLVDSHYI